MTYARVFHETSCGLQPHALGEPQGLEEFKQAAGSWRIQEPQENRRKESAMHELSIACNLVEIVEEAARAAGAVRVTRVRLRLGDLAGVVEDALRFSFPVAAQGTLAEGAELVIERVPVRVFCSQCNAERTLTPPFVYRCPECGASRLRLLQGRELQVESIEIEENHDETAHPRAAQSSARQK